MIKSGKMKKSVAFLIVAFCALIGALVGGYFGYAHSINAMTTDTATISLYIEPYEEAAGTEVIERELGSTGLYRGAEGEETTPSRAVAEEEYPADIIAEPRTNYYPLLGFIAILLAIILLILWRFRKKPARKTGRRKKKR